MTTQRAEVVVLGGGVIGTSIAWHLAQAGVREVVVLEARALGSGSSGKPLGGVRAQFSDPANIALGLRSLEAFRRFGTDFGTDIGLQQVGYLFLLRERADVGRFAASIAVQNALGVPSRMVDASEAQRLCAYVDPDVVLAAAWSPSDGYARPAAVVAAYARAAAGLGAEVRTGTEVVGIDSVVPGEAAVRTRDGDTVVTPTVVCATGAWSRAVATMVGVDLPVDPLRRQVAFTPALDPAPQVPFTIDYSSTAYLHGAGDGRLLMGLSDPAQEVGFDTSVSEDWHHPLRAALRVVAPGLADVPLGGGWAGLYEVTPDRDALIGEADAGFRFLYATGFSGHGFLQAPAVGEVVRDLYLARTPVVDVSGFTASRFSRPRPATS